MEMKLTRLNHQYKTQTVLEINWLFDKQMKEQNCVHTQQGKVRTVTKLCYVQR